MKVAALAVLVVLAGACGGDDEPGSVDAGGTDDGSDDGDTGDDGDASDDGDTGDDGDASDDDGDTGGDGDAGDDGDTGDDGSDGEPAELAGILAAHNQVRADHGVAPLSWDPQLAAIASDWAAGCRDQDEPIGLIDHNPGRSDAFGSYVGENVYGSSGPTGGPAAVGAWAEEESDYDHDSNTCSGICGHYTQIVWAEFDRGRLRRARLPRPDLRLHDRLRLRAGRERRRPALLSRRRSSAAQGGAAPRAVTSSG